MGDASAVPRAVLSSAAASSVRPRAKWIRADASEKSDASLLTTTAPHALRPNASACSASVTRPK